jgi:solute:Na+ symporter, SSS family
MSEQRTLDPFSLAALLVSAHYGLGFLLGTAEQSLTLGLAGSLYAVSLGVGTIALLGLAKFYWTRVEQIWTLLGDRYGNQVKILVGFMSWASLIGIESVQMISGAFILKVLGFPVIVSMVFLALLFTLISVLPVEKAGFLFRGLLLVNLLALIYGLWVLHGIPDYLRSPIDFVGSLKQVNTPNLIGISLCTILLVIIDMKYQQFVVRAKNLKTLYQGCLLAAFLLIMLAFLPSSVVIAAQNMGILPPDINGKETLPFILSWIGGGTDKPLGIMLIMSLLVPALGVGSSILRIQTKTILDFNILPKFKLERLLVALVNVSLALAVALRGGNIVELIVSFYAVYVAAVFIPFVTYLITEIKGYTFSKSSIKISLIMGCIAAISLLIFNLIKPKSEIFGNLELDIMIGGISFGLLGLFTMQIKEKYFPVEEQLKRI